LKDVGGGGSDHRNLRSYARGRLFEKKENNFQLISTLFYEVKRGFADR
jgi:hypothetical protein